MMPPTWLETMLAKWSGDFRNVLLPGTPKTAGEVADAILDPFSSPRGAASALLKEACDFISDERDALFHGHSVNGELRIECSADRRAAKAIAEMDEWLLRAGKVLNEGGRDHA